MRAILDRLLGRKPAPPPARPLTETERQRLAHRKRTAERDLRRIEKTLRSIGCSTCVQQAPPPAAIQMERHADALRREIDAIERRLA